MKRISYSTVYDEQRGTVTAQAVITAAVIPNYLSNKDFEKVAKRHGLLYKEAAITSTTLCRRDLGDVFDLTIGRKLAKKKLRVKVYNKLKRIALYSKELYEAHKLEVDKTLDYYTKEEEYHSLDLDTYKKVL